LASRTAPSSPTTTSSLPSCPVALSSTHRLISTWPLAPLQVYGIPADRLYVTYFEGDAAQGLEVDDEARKLWLEVGVPEDHILTGNAKVRLRERAQELEGSM
jgi:hypothetical protein